jgi:hypothetical protein
MIKKLLAIAAVATAGLLSTTRADAGHSSHASTTYRSGHSSCGCPIYTQRFVRGYDCYRRPIFGYSQVPISHGRSCGHRVVHHPRPCPPPAPVYRHHRSHGHGVSVSIGRPGISIGFGTGGHSHGSSRGRSCR